MRKAYNKPVLRAYGRIHELTLGATGAQPDAVIIGGIPQIDDDNPTCTNNVSSGYCYHF